VKVDTRDNKRALIVGSSIGTAFGVIFAIVQIFVSAVSTAFGGIQSWPYLTIQYAGSGNGKLDLFVQNDGNGPALIRSVTVQHDGKLYRNWGELNQAVFGNSDSGFDYKNKIDGVVIPPNAQRYVLASIGTPNAYDFVSERFLKVGSKNVSVCYCSSLSISPLGRTASWVTGLPVCWIVDRRFSPTPVDGTCPAPSFRN
jgi:hypothetical protein